MTAGYRIADIGTDHAYIPISLVEGGKSPSAVAMDVNRGPLERARFHVKEHRLEDRITMRLSDGFSAFQAGEADAAVIAGMGGALMVRILADGTEKVRSLKECILQPQSEIERVRAFLLEEGFLFIQEDMVEEDGKYYPMMKVAPPGTDKGFPEKSRGKQAGISWDETELRYGRLLLENRHEVLGRFLEREIRIREKILSNLDNTGDERIRKRADELKKELKYARKGMEYYALQGNHAGDRGDLLEGRSTGF